MPIRVLHAPGLAAGNPSRLASAERELGLASRCVSWEPNPLGYPVDELMPSAGEGRLRFELGRWKLLARSLRSFDVVHFNFGQTFFPSRLVETSQAAQSYSGAVRAAYGCYSRLLELRDLPLLKALGKAVFVTFQGDDARQGDYCRAHFEITFADRAEPGYYTPDTDAAKRRRIEAFGRYADGIYALNPDLLHVLPERAKFVPYANVDVREWRSLGTRLSSGPPVLVHAPTHRLVKGTDVILEAISRLKAEGIALEFVLVEGMTREVARELYARADLCVDQLFAGWYGGLAVELMALGKPVMSFIREGDLGFVPKALRTDLPVINVAPATLYGTLKAWLQRSAEDWRRAGERSRAFVEKWHDPVRIAARMKADYEAVLAGRRS